MSYACLASHYDSLTEDVDYQTRCAYITGFFNQYGITEGLLLDLACGTGRMSLCFAAKGYDVIGVDASPEMLCVAKENAARVEFGENILFLCQQMEALDLYGTVRCCVCSLDSINHLPDEAAVLAAFQRLALFLEPGGVFVFDVNTAYKHSQVLGDNTFVYEEEDFYLVWQNDYDAVTETVEITLDLFEEVDGVYHRSTDYFAERAFSIETLSALLQTAGFHLDAVYDELTKELPRPDSERLYFIARKR